jgi:hypothetical protein
LIPPDQGLAADGRRRRIALIRRDDRINDHVFSITKEVKSYRISMSRVVNGLKTAGLSDHRGFMDADSFEDRLEYFDKE